MTEIVVTDCNLNSVCERLEERCCVDEPPVTKSHSNTGAKLWGRVRSKLLRQKCSFHQGYELQLLDTADEPFSDDSRGFKRHHRDVYSFCVLL
ncbi:active breakpoint cluster region-related protein isoform X4 [Tachysurus ichikawai]